MEQKKQDDPEVKSGKVRRNSAFQAVGTDDVKMNSTLTGRV
jgi:hypothetical protein